MFNITLNLLYLYTLRYNIEYRTELITEFLPVKLQTVIDFNKLFLYQVSTWPLNSYKLPGEFQDCTLRKEPSIKQSGSIMYDNWRVAGWPWAARWVSTQSQTVGKDQLGITIQTVHSSRYDAARHHLTLTWPWLVLSLHCGIHSNVRCSLQRAMSKVNANV